MESRECDTCWYYDYDEEFDEYYCMMDLDEDEFCRFFPPAETGAHSTGRVTIIPWPEGNKNSRRAKWVGVIKQLISTPIGFAVLIIVFIRFL